VKAAERHKLKHDQYAETVMSGLHWAKVHQSKVIAIVAVLVIVGAAVAWTLHARMQAQQDAETQFTEYQASADRALGLKDEARTEAIKDALSHFDGLVKAYPDSDVAPQALVRAAELLNATGQPAKAAGYYQRLVEMAGAPEGMKMLARRGWAAALEQSGDVEKAIVEYKALADASTPQEAVEADWDIGRCYEILKDPENAKTFYRKAIESGGESKWTELARFRVETLERGPTPPMSAAPSVPLRPASKEAGEQGAPATTGFAPTITLSAPATTASMPATTASTPEATAAAPATTAPAEAGTAPDAAEKTAPE
jgi:tetratricopeptide (TPR) repeat protein